MATDVAQREATGNSRPAIRGGPVLVASLTAADVPGWAVRRPQVTKLMIRGFRELRAGAVSRAGLVEAARSSGCRLVAITAPAGYGKSTFLAEWAAAEDRRVVWVRLDRFDDDPAMLVVSLASACCRAGLGGADLVAGMEGAGGPAAGDRHAGVQPHGRHERGRHDGQSDRQPGIRQRHFRATALSRRFPVCGIRSSGQARIGQ